MKKLKRIKDFISTSSESDLDVDVSDVPTPEELEPVIAKIEDITSLGKSTYWEVVYYDKGWCAYEGSRTFKNGQRVLQWEYCKDIT
jgi:hypothetical protein